MQHVPNPSRPLLPTMIHYRRRRPGPELALEEAFLSDLAGVLDSSKRWWLAGSLPLGAGLPDLIAVHYEGALDEVEDLCGESIEALAYLRAVGQARLDTVAKRLRFSAAVAEATASFLREVGALRPVGGPLALTPVWRTLLSEVVAIEFKVADWRRALSQATRNLLFAHRSFVALPAEVAKRVRSYPDFAIHGVGIVSVPGEGQATIVRRAREGSPRSWRYYYKLASRVAMSGDSLAV